MAAGETAQPRVETAEQIKPFQARPEVQLRFLMAAKGTADAYDPAKEVTAAPEQIQQIIDDPKVKHEDITQASRNESRESWPAATTEALYQTQLNTWADGVKTASADTANAQLLQKLLGLPAAQTVQKQDILTLYNNFIYDKSETTTDPTTTNETVKVTKATEVFQEAVKTLFPTPEEFTAHIKEVTWLAANIYGKIAGEAVVQSMDIQMKASKPEGKAALKADLEAEKQKVIPLEEDKQFLSEFNRLREGRIRGQQAATNANADTLLPPDPNAPARTQLRAVAGVSNPAGNASNGAVQVDTLPARTGGPRIIQLNQSPTGVGPGSNPPSVDTLPRLTHPGLIAAQRRAEAAAAATSAGPQTPQIDNLAPQLAAPPIETSQLMSSEKFEQYKTGNTEQSMREKGLIGSAVDGQNSQTIVSFISQEVLGGLATPQERYDASPTMVLAKLTEYIQNLPPNIIGRQKYEGFKSSLQQMLAQRNVTVSNPDDVVELWEAVNKLSPDPDTLTTYQAYIDATAPVSLQNPAAYSHREISNTTPRNKTDVYIDAHSAEQLTILSQCLLHQENAIGVTRDSTGKLCIVLNDGASSGVMSAIFARELRDAALRHFEAGDSLSDIYLRAFEESKAYDFPIVAGIVAENRRTHGEFNPPKDFVNELYAMSTSNLVRFDSQTGILEFVNKGDSPIIIINPDKSFEYIDSANEQLKMRESLFFVETPQHRQLQKGALVMVCSDGFGDIVEYSALQAFVNQMSSISTSEVTRVIESRMKSKVIQDDVSIAAFQY